MVDTTKNKVPMINREISWLYFNERVLQEAADPNVPLLERLRFLGIFSSNLDEFYRVRVATLTRLAALNHQKTKELLGFNPKHVLNQIKNLVVKQERRFDYLYEQEIIPQLEANKIFIINEKQLNVQRGEFVREYFRKEVWSNLVPVMLDFEDPSRANPEMADQRVYLYIKLTFRKKAKYAMLRIPSTLPRFLVLPENKGLKFIILLDDIIRYCLDDLFFLFDFDQIEAYSIQLTRDSELDLDVKLSDKFLEALEKSLLQRGKGRPMRLLYDSDIPSEMLDMLVSRIGVHSEALIPSGRYHRFKDFIKFPPVGENLVYEPLPPLRLKELVLTTSLFNQIARKDVLVHLPYQSFDYIVHFLREAAIDPKTQEIYICLYRLAENSNVINALINAARNGKKVFCMIELKARFDEEANIDWMNRLVEGGVSVNIGMTDFKVHAKVCLVSRIEKKKKVYYANLATGNFNEKTAKAYADHSLFTADPLITKDLKKLFKGLAEQKFYTGYKSLICSPTETREKLYHLIDQEIAYARSDRDAYITLKMNSLTDQGMVRKLYEASQAGVRIELIVRGMCCLIPGLPGFSENIRVRSIVDRFLEHARVWIFGNDGKKLMYLSSADLMTRNIDHRVEVAFPIADESLQDEICKILDIQLRDNTKAREINATQNNRYIGRTQKVRNRAQYDIYHYLKYKT